MVCFAVTACSGPEESTASEGTTTSQDTNLPAYARSLQPQIEEQMTNLRVPGALVNDITRTIIQELPGPGGEETSGERRG